MTSWDHSDLRGGEDAFVAARSIAKTCAPPSCILVYDWPLDLEELHAQKA